MARPQKNNLDYFPHDNSMRNDRKIKALRAKFEHKGYAIYNMLLEILCEADLLILKWDETEIELVSGDLNIVSDELTQVSEYLFHIKLLKQVNGYVFCPQLDKRSESVFGKRTKDLNSLRIENGINVTETNVSESKIPQTLPETPQSKVKESKVNNNKGNHLYKNSEFCDNISLIKEKIGIKYHEYNLTYYNEVVKNWSASKGAMKKDWIATIRNFILGDIKKGNPRYAK